MAAEDDAVPMFVRVKHSVRVIAADPENLEKNLTYVVRVILEDFGRVSRREILAIQDYPKRGVYDVTFDGEGVYRSFLGILEKSSSDPRLDGFKVLPHFTEEVFLVVKPYSPFVPLKEIEVVLGRYCEKLVFAGKILNELGIWTCKYKFKVIFRKGTFPPSRFRLGTVNVDCFFKGMPDFCKKCRQYGHTIDGCLWCQNCGKEGHEGKSCSLPKRCNLCLQEGHLYAKCPQRKEESAEVLSEMGELPIPVDVPPRSSGEEVVAGDDSQEGPAIKRKKEKKEKKEKIKKPENLDVSSESSSSTNVHSPTRGEKLYKYFRCKSDEALQEALRDWPCAEEYEEMVETCIKGFSDDIARFRLLNYLRELK